MIVVLLNVYLVILFLLVKFNIVRFNLFWKTSPFLVLLLLLIGLFIPMGWGAPQGSAVVVRNSVAIVPDVAGEVIDVPVTANTPLKAGDVLSKIDPTPYDAQVKAKAARLAPAIDAAMERLAHEPKPPKLPSDYSFPAMPRRWADETGSEEMREWLENFVNARAHGVREKGLGILGN